MCRLKRDICNGVVVLSVMAFAMFPSRAFGAVASRSLARFSGVTNFVASRSRLTTAIGIGAAVVGGCLLYRWWQTRKLLPITKRALFLSALPNGNLVVGEGDSNISVWDSKTKTCLKKIRIAETIPGEYLQIVVLSDNEIALLCRATGKVTLVHLNAQENEATYQDFERPAGRDSHEKEIISWIAKSRDKQLVCKTKNEHFYQLDRFMGKNSQANNAWVQLPNDMKIPVPAGALGTGDYLQVQLPGPDGKKVRVVASGLLRKGGVAVE